MEAEFPEGEEYILELFQDHYTALKEIPLDPQDALKYGSSSPTFYSFAVQRFQSRLQRIQRLLEKRTQLGRTFTV